MERAAAPRKEAKRLRELAADSEGEPDVYYKLLALARECEGLAQWLANGRSKEAKSPGIWR